MKGILNLINNLKNFVSNLRSRGLWPAQRSMYVSDLHFSKNGKRIPVDAVGMEVLILVLPAKHADDDDDVFVLRTMVG